MMNSRFRLDKGLETQLDFEKMLSDISARFINAPAAQLSDVINDALKRVCEFLDCDIAALWRWSADRPEAYVLTNLYRRFGGPPVPEVFDAKEFFPWTLQKNLHGETLVYSSLDEVPPEGARDRESWIHFGIKSNLSFPLTVANGGVLGSFALSMVREEREWPESLVTRLHLVAQICANALARNRSELALRESEERLSLTTDSAEVGLWILEYRTRVFWATEKARAIFGYSPDEIIDMDRLQASVHPDDWHLVQTSIERSAQTGDPVNVEYRIRLSDGRMRWVTSRGQPQLTPAGEPKRLMGISIDTTDRKGAEEALRTGKDRLEAGTELAGLGYYEVDFGGPSVFADNRFHEICGVPPGQHPGLESVQFWIDHLHPDDRQHVLDERGKLQDGSAERIAIEYRYLHPVNGSRWIEHEARVSARDATGRAVRTFGVVRDITERKRMQEALRVSEEVSRATFEQAAVGVAHVGTDGRFLRVNDKLCAIVRYPRDELLQLTFKDITHPDDLETDLNCVRQVLSGEIESYSMEKRYFRKDRSLVWVNLTVSLVRSAEGEPRFFISVVEDITERKRTEAALHYLGGRLIHAQEEERVRLAKELHDGLSQSLALLAVELEMFGQRPPRARAQLDARLKEFSAQTTALAAEVRHISHGLHPAALTQLGIAVALKSHCREVAAAHQIEVGFTATGVPHSLTEDVALSLYRVAQEALQNAVKHSGTKKATVELMAADDTIELSITDHGRGFEAAAGRASGSLGLVSMEERVRFVGGEMAIESQPGQGTRIRVRVPLPEGTTATGMGS